MKNTNEKRIARTERLKSIRLLLGFTQKQFAERLGMSREGYQKLERGENNISLDVLEKLKTVYGVSADYLLYGEFQDEEKMWYMLKNCSETTKLEMLIRLIGYFTSSGSSSFSEKEFDFEKLFKEISTWNGQ
ncbi:MAG: helix-turn-helix transcriptional regulator [Lachnospiraceae bacterium]|nr:helix-turn-helix transcriptional regulator [Lachnospiraceae bacterium]